MPLRAHYLLRQLTPLSPTFSYQKGFPAGTQTSSTRSVARAPPPPASARAPPPATLASPGRLAAQPPRLSRGATLVHIRDVVSPSSPARPPSRPFRLRHTHPPYSHSWSADRPRPVPSLPHPLSALARENRAATRGAGDTREPGRRITESRGPGTTCISASKGRIQPSANLATQHAREP